MQSETKVKNVRPLIQDANLIISKQSACFLWICDSHVDVTTSMNSDALRCENGDNCSREVNW